jgi:hypothetical protein
MTRIAQLKALLPLGYSVAIALALAFVVVPSLAYDNIMTDVSSWGSFFTVMGVVYAIIVGFLLATVLTRYSYLTQSIEGELNAIECIRDSLIYFDESQADSKQALLQALRSYVHSVAEVEWQEMSAPGRIVNSDTSEELYELMRECSNLKPTGENGSIALSKLFDNVAEIAKLRTNRICLANEQLPPRLKLLVAFLSLVLVVGFTLMGVANSWVHLVMLVSVTICVHLLYMVIEDLDHPFYGVWNVDKSALAQLDEQIDAALG